MASKKATKKPQKPKQTSKNNFLLNKFYVWVTSPKMGYVSLTQDNMHLYTSEEAAMRAKDDDDSCEDWDYAYLAELHLLPKFATHVKEEEPDLSDALQVEPFLVKG